MHAAIFLQRREALHKFSQFDTSVKLLCILKTEKAPQLLIVCYSEFQNLQNHAFMADSDDGVATLRECRSAVRIGSSNLLACPSKQSCTPNFRPLSVHTAPRRISHLLASLRSASLRCSRTAPPPLSLCRTGLLSVLATSSWTSHSHSVAPLQWERRSRWLGRSVSFTHREPTLPALLRRILHPSQTALAGHSGLSSPCRCRSC